MELKTILRKDKMVVCGSTGRRFYWLSRNAGKEIRILIKAERERVSGIFRFPVFYQTEKVKFDF